MALMLLVMYFIKNIDLEAADAERQMQLERDARTSLPRSRGPMRWIPGVQQMTAQGGQTKTG